MNSRRFRRFQKGVADSFLQPRPYGPFPLAALERRAVNRRFGAGIRAYGGVISNGYIASLLTGSKDRVI